MGRPVQPGQNLAVPGARGAFGKSACREWQCRCGQRGAGECAGAGPVLHLLAQLQEKLEATDGDNAHLLLRQQLQKILAGEQQSEFGTRAAPAAVLDARHSEMVEQLTKRELATLQLLVEGLSNKEIADRRLAGVTSPFRVRHLFIHSGELSTIPLR